MKGIFSSLAFLSMALWASTSWAGYSENLCNEPGYDCIRVQKHQSWEKLFPNEEQRAIVMRINRMNTELYRGMVIAVPHDLQYTDFLSLAPFDHRIQSTGEKVIIVSTSKLAWGAYDASGNLVHWGPVSAGRDYCPDEGRRCHTVTGTFHVYEKRGEDCFSRKFPVGKGGAPMPYCMFFHGGFALHGSPGEVPGYNASHGCVRLFPSDAQWLNEEFIELPNKENKFQGTKVIIEPYAQLDEEEDSDEPLY